MLEPTDEDVERLFGDLAAISAEWDTPLEATHLLVALLLMARLDGREGIDWAVEHGYMDRDDEKWWITDAGQDAARQYLEANR